jgi:hypothetical protein
VEGAPIDHDREVEISRMLYRAYSGYVHAASPQIMDMYGGNPPKFHMRGMRETPRHREHSADLWNYFYRSLCALSIVAKAFGDEALFTAIRDFTGEFERLSGKNYGPSESQKA